MFPPMRPRPTMPSFTGATAEQLGEGDAAGADAARLEGAEVAGGLRLLEVAEAERLRPGWRSRAGRRRRPGRTRSARGPPLWSWPVECRKRGPNPRLVATRCRSRSATRAASSRAARRAARVDERLQGEVVARLGAGRGGRRAARSGTSAPPSVEHLGGGGLGGGDVGLVEGLHTDGRAGEGDGQLHRDGQVADAVGARRRSHRRAPGDRPPRSSSIGSWERNRRSSP